MTALPINGTLFQEAYFVDDIDRAAAAWSATFGAGPFFVAEHHQCDRFDYRGTATEADVSYAFGYLGEMMIQFIVQHDDQPSIYRDMYPDGVPAGFHHLGFLVDDFEAEFNRLIDAGFTCATRLFADDVDAAYFDTRDVTGGFTEIHGTPPHILESFARWRAAHAKHEVGDPATAAHKRQR